MVALYLVSVVPLDYAAMAFVPTFIVGVLLLAIIALSIYRMVEALATKRKAREDAIRLVRRYGVAVLVAILLDLPHTILAVYDDCWYWVCGWGWWN